MDTEDTASLVNTISSFLAPQHVTSLRDLEHVWKTQDKCARSSQLPIDVIVLCGSAILHTAETVFRTLQQYQNSNARHSHRLILVICGGHGHSTQFLYDAIAAHPKYRVLLDEISGSAESRVLELIAVRYFGLPTANDDTASIDQSAQKPGEIFVIVEDQSTNCGANAAKTKEALDEHGITSPRTIVVCQEPTMCRRTIASFQQVYSGAGNRVPKFYGWPTFVPTVVDIRTSNTESTPGGQSDSSVLTQLAFDCSLAGVPISAEGLWTMPRFLDLILGEIPRMRNDEHGYGPNGKGFIAAVDIPDEVEAAWHVVFKFFKGTRASETSGK